MVWFQCEDCGENLKKPKLPNHFNRCSAHKLSCIDCGVVFNQQSVQSHTSCVTEVEKYGPKGLNKGASGGALTLKESNGKQSGADVDLSLGLSTSAPWSCSLCKVKATGRETLELHSKGKKHRSRAKVRAAAAAAKQKNAATQIEGLEAAVGLDSVICTAVRKEEMEDTGTKEEATAAAAPSTVDATDLALDREERKGASSGAVEGPPPGLQETTKSEKKQEKKLKRHNLSAVAVSASKDILLCADEGAKKPLDHHDPVRGIQEKKRKHQGEEEQQEQLQEQQKQQKSAVGVSVNGEHGDHKKKKSKKKDKHVEASAVGGNDTRDHHDTETTGVAAASNVVEVLCLGESNENREQANKIEKKGSHKRKSSVHPDKSLGETNEHANGAEAGLSEPSSLAGATPALESNVGDSALSTSTAHEKQHSGKKSKKLKRISDKSESGAAAAEISGVVKQVEYIGGKIIANKEKALNEKKATGVEISVHDVSFREWLGDEGGDVGGEPEGTPTHPSPFDVVSRKNILKEDQQLLQRESHQNIGGAGSVEGQLTQDRIARVVKWKKIVKEIIAKLVQSVNGKMKQKDVTRAVLPLAQRAIDSSALSVDRKALKAELMRQVSSSPKFVVDGKHIMLSPQSEGTRLN